MLESNIGGAKKLTDCYGRMSWPKRGVYFFRELGENRTDTGEGSRVVRVGTHALKSDSGTKLCARLSQHKGQQVSGSGNHRDSTFRLIVGASLISRDGAQTSTWGNGNTVPRDVRDGELALEREVSLVIGAMPFVWLSLGDEASPESRRGYIERNSIALLSNRNEFALDLPSKEWLGRHSDRNRVRESGLWNSRHHSVRWDETRRLRTDEISVESGQKAD